MRRAAGCDPDAILALMDISRPIIARRCPAFSNFAKEDFIQTVILQLLGKFYNPQKPFVAHSFASYHTYLNTTIVRVLGKMGKEDQHYLVVDFNEIEKASPETVSARDENEAEQQALKTEEKSLIQLCLESLRDKPEEQAIVYHRFFLRQKPAEIAVALQAAFPGITLAQVRTHYASAMRRMKKLPRVQTLLKNRGRQVNMDKDEEIV